jgi:hypothetical protein
MSTNEEVLVEETEWLNLEVEDFTGQMRHRAKIPKDVTVGEFVAAVSEQLKLPEQDAQGRPVIYGARTAHGDLLNASDRVGDVVLDDEVVTLTKSATAG